MIIPPFHLFSIFNILRLRGLMARECELAKRVQSYITQQLQVTRSTPQGLFLFLCAQGLFNLVTITIPPFYLFSIFDVLRLRGLLMARECELANGVQSCVA
jgi:hypothetical protein